MIISALTREELDALLSVAWNARERDGILLAVTYNHAFRASEVVGLTADDVSEYGIRIVGLKKGETVTQPLIEVPERPLLSERKPLLELISGLISYERVFAIGRHRLWEIMQRYGKLAGLPPEKRHPHSLRHTCAMDLIERVGIEKTRMWLRHRNMGSTGVYLKPTQQAVNASVIAAMRAPLAVSV